VNDRLTENLDDQVWYAIKLIKEHEYTDGEHHKQWVLNQVLLLLTGGAEHLEDEGTIP
jgi:hypothetical protein